MPWSGSGAFSRIFGATGWTDDRDAATFIVASRHDTHDQDLAEGINLCVTKDGQSQMTTHFIPNSTNAYDLGSSSFSWRNIFGTLLSSFVKYDITSAEIAAGVTPVNSGYLELDPHRYSNTLNHTAVQIAVNVAAQKTGGGRVPIRENFAFTSPVAMALNVIIEWDGGTISCNNCGAFTFGFYTAVGRHGIVGPLPINGTNCETSIAIDQPGSGSDADQCYGIFINGPQVRNFNKVIRLRTAWFFDIQNVRGENINSGCDLAGYNILGHMSHNKFVKAAGCGTGASNGYLFDAISFTNGGAHFSNPEGIYGVGNEAYGFDVPLNLNVITGLEFCGTDLLGTVNAIKFSTTADFVSVSGYFAVVGSTATACIKGAGQGSIVNAANVKFTGKCIATGTTSCLGLQLDDYGVNQNQAFVDIDLDFSGFTSYDIGLFSSGNVNIKRGTKCKSTALATSIRITGTLAGRPITIEDGVYCAGRVVVPFADTQLGQVLVGALTGAYSTYVRGVSTITNPATSVTTTFNSLLGTNNIPSFAATADTDMVLDLFLGTPSADVDGVWGSAAVNQVTINVNTTPATSVVIPWEVRVRMRYS